VHIILPGIMANLQTSAVIYGENLKQESISGRDTRGSLTDAHHAGNATGDPNTATCHAMFRSFQSEDGSRGTARKG